MTESKIMYLLEIWMNKSGLWHNFKPRQSTILSNIYKNLNIYFPGYNAIILKSGNIEMVFWATVYVKIK